MDYAFVSARHIRAARGWLGWRLVDLEAKSGVTIGAVNKFENETKNLSLKTRKRLAEVFAAAGVELRPDGLRAGEVTR